MGVLVRLLLLVGCLDLGQLVGDPVSVPVVDAPEHGLGGLAAELLEQPARALWQEKGEPDQLERRRHGRKTEHQAPADAHYEQFRNFDNLFKILTLFFKIRFKFLNDRRKKAITFIYERLFSSCFTRKYI